MTEKLSLVWVKKQQQQQSRKLKVQSSVSNLESILHGELKRAEGRQGCQIKEYN